MKRTAAALEEALTRLAAAQLTRTRLTLSPDGPLPGRTLAGAAGRLVDFSSNDYLGLARHPLPAPLSAAHLAMASASAGWRARPR